MNPWAFLLGGLGVILIMIGVLGTQHEVAALVTGHAPASGSGSTTTGPNAVSAQGRKGTGAVQGPPTGLAAKPGAPGFIGPVQPKPGQPGFIGPVAPGTGVVPGTGR